MDADILARALGGTAEAVNGMNVRLMVGQTDTARGIKGSRWEPTPPRQGGELSSSFLSTLEKLVRPTDLDHDDPTTVVVIERGKERGSKKMDDF